MFGKSEIECGNYINLSVDAAKCEAERFLEKIKNITEKDLVYPKGE